MKALTIVAALLVLTGCSTVTAPQPGLTKAELEDYYQLQADVTWRGTTLADELRPPAPEVQIVTGDEWAAVLADCMNSAGFDNYKAAAGGLSSYQVFRPADEALAEQLTWFTCQSSVRLQEQEEFLLNPAEVDYLYEYYQEVLAPCLIINGVDLYEAPTRTEFIEAGAWWNPYFSIPAATMAQLTVSILATCPAMPPGMPDRGITEEYFGRAG